MKKVMNLMLCVLFSTAVFAQETGLVDIPAKNPEHLKPSKYVQFATSAGQFSLIQANFCGFLKLLSSSTMGGYNIFAVKMFDKTSGASYGALQISPNSASGIAKVGSDVANTVTKTVTAGLIELGGATQTFFVDQEELPILLEKLTNMKKAMNTTPGGFVTFTYVCQGGFTVTAGYNITLKKPIWLGTVGTTSEMPLGGFLDELIMMCSKGQEALDKMK